MQINLYPVLLWFCKDYGSTFLYYCTSDEYNVLIFAYLFLLFKPCIENTMLWLNYLKFNKNNQFE